eukprot:6989612-Prymnesium_polylepis.2
MHTAIRCRRGRKHRPATGCSYRHPDVWVNANGGSPPPVDQPWVEAVAKVKLAVGGIGGSEGGSGGENGGVGGGGGGGGDCGEGGDSGSGDDIGGGGSSGVDAATRNEHTSRPSGAAVFGAVDQQIVVAARGMRFYFEAAHRDGRSRHTADCAGLTDPMTWHGPEVDSDPAAGGEGDGGGGSDRDGDGQQSSHPEASMLPSVVQVMLPLEATTPAGPELPQYLMPSISR